MRQSIHSTSLARRNNFDFVAPFYDSLATLVFGNALRRAQVHLLPQVADAKRVLIIGGGTGWFLKALLKTIPAPHVLYIEKSSKMLAASQALISDMGTKYAQRVEFRQGTEGSLHEQDGVFDLVVTNFFLDLFSEANSLAVARHLECHFAPTGRWLFVDFELPENGLAHLYARLLFRVMFTFFNIVSQMESRQPPNYDRIFSALGLRVIQHERFYVSIVHAKLLQRA